MKSVHISEHAATWRLWPVVQQEYGKIGFLSYDAAPPMGVKFSDIFFISLCDMQKITN